jgi:hypothetical protein
MSQHPETRAKKTLHKGIEKPKNSSEGRRWDVLRCQKAIEEVEGDGQGDHVPSDIVETSGGRSLETVLGDGPVDIANGIIRDLERVAICVNQLLLFRSLFRRDVF